MGKRRIDPIWGRRVCLRQLQERDLGMLLAWRNQPHIRRWFIRSALITPEQHRAWFETYTGRDDDFMFIIEERTAGCLPIGQIALYGIDWMEKSAECGRILIGEADATGKGFAKEATSLLVDFAVHNLGLQQIQARIMESNGASIAVFRACGFQESSRADGLLFMIRPKL